MRPAATEMAACGVLELGGRQPAVLLRPCLQPFPSPARSTAFFGRKAGAGTTDAAAERSPAGEKNAVERLFDPEKPRFSLSIVYKYF